MTPVPVRTLILSALIAGCLAAGAACAASPATVSTAGPAAKSPAGADEAASYSLGVAFATEWKEGGLTDTLSEAALVRGIHDALGGKALTTDDRRIASGFLQGAYERLGARNKAAAVDFLARNAKAPGVRTTASGLQYIVETAGDAAGAAPGPNDRVTVNYRGTLLNGTEFDSTYTRGQPAAIRVSNVIAGWREVLPLMTPHAKWKVFVPPELAYGSTPPGTIPTNSLLVFEIELLGVESAGAPPQAAH